MRLLPDVVPIRLAGAAPCCKHNTALHRYGVKPGVSRLSTVIASASTGGIALRSRITTDTANCLWLAVRLGGQAVNGPHHLEDRIRTHDDEVGVERLDQVDEVG